jgi:hypothetical protein
VSHIVTESSPLASLTKEAVEAARSSSAGELLGGKITVIFTGVDFVLADNVMARHVYDVVTDIEFDRKFAPMLVCIELLR